MYADGGHLYVFLVYGMHYCANVVTRKKGIAEAVLLRAAEGPAGTPVRLLSGPGRLCAGLGVTVVGPERTGQATRIAYILRQRSQAEDRSFTEDRSRLCRGGQAVAAPFL